MVPGTDEVVKGCALRVLLGADSFDDELLGNVPGQLATVRTGDQVEHQIDRADAAGTGIAVAVDDKKPRRNLNSRELLAQPG